MFTADELKTLSDQIAALRDHIEESPDNHEPTAAGYLLDADWHTLQAASKVVHRLYRWREWPTVSPESYLPALIEAAPDSGQA